MIREKIFSFRQCRSLQLWLTVWEFKNFRFTECFLEIRVNVEMLNFANKVGGLGPKRPKTYWHNIWIVPNFLITCDLWLVFYILFDFNSTFSLIRSNNSDHPLSLLYLRKIFNKKWKSTNSRNTPLTNVL